LNLFNYAVKLPEIQTSGSLQMVNAYNLLKFLHVLSVIVWVGGVTALSALAWRVRGERNREVLKVLLPQLVGYGQRMIGPASGIVLLTGLAMVGMARIGFLTFWVVWGYAGIILHSLLGAIVIRKRTMKLGQLAAANTDDATLGAASRSLWQAQLLYMLILASVVGAMVIKPTLR
jgi:uncharacterized membrane protein